MVVRRSSRLKNLHSKDYVIDPVWPKVSVNDLIRNKSECTSIKDQIRNAATSKDGRSVWLENPTYPSQDGPSKSIGIVRLKAKSKAKSRKESKHSDDDFDNILMSYATDAMSFYNKGKDTKYELLECGCITSAVVRPYFLHHINFTAKKAGVADAPEEMFFAELKTVDGVCFVELCISLGAKSLISGERINGCSYCNMYGNVKHPEGVTAGKFMNFSEWKKNRDSFACSQ
ncbi:hypothetical protein MKW98_012349 [Papaver atlanticum]|uniref:DUF3615 domain-containing protein n=1 Tax=Papaver atlanticum TaxID=357466 RepID=A0AAD4T1U7_9MAGN|nr:hypothetical protein MKW98_012349 [Papaver atlanticum]